MYRLSSIQRNSLINNKSSRIWFGQSRAVSSVLPTNRGFVFWILFSNDEPTNVLIRLFVTNNPFCIDYALEEQHSLKRKKSFNNDQQTNSAIKNQNKSGEAYKIPYIQIYFVRFIIFDISIHKSSVGQLHMGSSLSSPVDPSERAIAYKVSQRKSTREIHSG